ncbi:uncharacterized protein [Rutidosis leptorrhynchoides]|uniref:uncharacterized protein n=1 Tax=Rutidosis leptorrhynchoides TaxID=125765 RepID=UPI003A99D253
MLSLQLPSTLGNTWKKKIHDNKRSKTVELNAELRGLEIGDMTIEAYFRKLDQIDAHLKNLGSTVDDGDLVMYAINGLTNKYPHLSHIILHRENFPDLNTVRSMFTMEEMTTNRKTRSPSEANSSNPSVLMAQSVNSSLQSSTQSQTQTQETILPSAFSAMTLQDYGVADWHMDTGASSHLTSCINSLSTIFNHCKYPSVAVGNGNIITVTNTSHNMLPNTHRPLHLNNFFVTPNIVKNLISFRQFTRDNKVSVEFDPFGFSVKDYLTRRLLLRCDSTGDLYPVTQTLPQALTSCPTTWHQRLGHPGNDVLRRLISNKNINCNKMTPHVLCHACQLGKHPRLPFSVSSSNVNSIFDIIHSDLWTSSISSLSSLKYKARLVANDRSQQVGIDCDETFSPVLKPDTIRTVLSLTISMHWPVHQLDVKNAFLHGQLSETVYMHQPPGFRDPRYPDHVCLLKKSLYGLKQAPHAWFPHFAGYAQRIEFHHSRCDTSLFIYRQGSNTAYLLLYVDDIVLTASSTGLLQRLINSLHREFVMTDLGPLNYFLGISVSCNASGMFLSQKQYASEILKHAFKMPCSPCRTSVDPGAKLTADGQPVSDPTLSQSCREPHFTALNRILRYVQGTINLELQLFTASPTSLVAYSEADWAGYPITRRSTLGYCVFLDNNLLSWSSKWQLTPSRSSAEAEYRGIANAVAKTCWIRNLLRELHCPLSSTTLVYYDNWPRVRFRFYMFLQGINMQTSSPKVFYMLYLTSFDPA